MMPDPVIYGGCCILDNSIGKEQNGLALGYSQVLQNCHLFGANIKLDPDFFLSGSRNHPQLLITC
jgi:hypothetical protein